MKSPRFPGLNSSSMVELSSSFEPRAWPRRTEVPVFGGESLTAGPGWRIGTSPLWLQIIGTEQSLCLPFLIPTQELRNEGGNWSVVEREGQGVKKKQRTCKAQIFVCFRFWWSHCVRQNPRTQSMSTVMNTLRETLSVLLQRARAGDTAELHHCQKCHGPWSNNLKLIARRRHPVHILNLPGSWLPRRRLLKVNCFFRSFLECPKDVTIIHNSSEVCDL